MSTEQKSHRKRVEGSSNAIIEAYNNGEPNRIDGFFADDFVCHLTGGGEVNGLDPYKDLIRSMRTAFPDFRKEQEFLVVEGEEAAVQYRWSGTHEGEFVGIPATGTQSKRPVRCSSVSTVSS